MNHLFRLAWLLLTAPFRSRVSIIGPAEIHLRVWPTDLDPLMHVNNGVYLSLLDLGRIDLLARSGAWQKIRREGVYPVVVSEAIRFRRSLTLFQKFRIETRLVDWDDNYFYLRQRYFVGSELYASAVIKGRFLRGRGEKVSTETLFLLAGEMPSRPTQNPIRTLLSNLDEELRE